MQFASEYVLVKEEALRKRRSPAAVVEDKKQEEEELDEFEEDELREGIRSHSIKSVSSSHPTAETRSTNPTKTQKFRRVDTNVFRVDLSTLSQEAFTATGMLRVSVNTLLTEGQVIRSYVPRVKLFSAR